MIKWLAAGKCPLTPIRPSSTNFGWLAPAIACAAPRTTAVSSPIAWSSPASACRCRMLMRYWRCCVMKLPFGCRSIPICARPSLGCLPANGKGSFACSGASCTLNDCRLCARHSPQRFKHLCLGGFRSYKSLHRRPSVALPLRQQGTTLRAITNNKAMCEDRVGALQEDAGGLAVTGL